MNDTDRFSETEVESDSHDTPWTSTSPPGDLADADAEGSVAQGSDWFIMRASAPAWIAADPAGSADLEEWR